MEFSKSPANCKCLKCAASSFGVGWRLSDLSPCYQSIRPMLSVQAGWIIRSFDAIDDWWMSHRYRSFLDEPVESWGGEPFQRAIHSVTVRLVFGAAREARSCVLYPGLSWVQCPWGPPLPWNVVTSCHIQMSQSWPCLKHTFWREVGS